jgi:hypothetical protein
MIPMIPNTIDETVNLLRRAHYCLMKSPRYWSDAGDMEASKILCVIASDMAAGFERPPGWFR